MQPTNEKIDFFRDLYAAARERAGERLDRFAACRAQYRTGRGGEDVKSSPIVRNITYELIESEVSTDIPMPRVTSISREGEGISRAHVFEQICRDLRERLPFEKLNDIDERQTYVYGGSVWLCEWDGEKNLPVISCISPECFIPEPEVNDIERMNYCFIVTSQSKAEIKRIYGKDVADDEDGEENPKVIICYWRNEKGQISRYIFSGHTELSDLENFYARRDGDGYELVSELLMGEKKTDGKVLPIGEAEYYLPNRFPIAIRKNVSKEGDLFGQSDCEVIRPQQEAINKIESRIYQKLVRSAVIPYMPEDCRVSPTNSVFGEVIRVDPSDSMAKFGVLDTTPNIEKDIEECDRLYVHARRALGITDSFTGESETSATSGYALSLKVSQSAGRLRSRRVMKNALYAELYRIIFGLYLAFCDENLSLGYTDALGELHKESFSRYDYLTYDSLAEKWVYEDGFIFSADRSAGSDGQNTESLREATLEYYKAGLFGDPDTDIARRLCWQRLESLGYPDAHAVAKLFCAKEIASQIDDNDAEVYCYDGE